jgi:hypothetical protein
MVPLGDAVTDGPDAPEVPHPQTRSSTPARQVACRPNALVRTVLATIREGDLGSAKESQKVLILETWVHF